MPVPHMLFAQTLLQHSLGPLHERPSGLHMSMPQTPALHTLAQHSVGDPQGTPSGLHISKPH